MTDVRALNPEMIAARVLQATAHDEAMRALAQARTFDFYQASDRYVVTFNGKTAADPMLARAILQAAQAAGVIVPPLPKLKLGES